MLKQTNNACADVIHYILYKPNRLDIIDDSRETFSWMKGFPVYSQCLKIGQGYKKGETIMKRSAKEIIEDHLDKSINSAMDEDLIKNYSEDVVILTSAGVFRGHPGLRKLNDVLQSELPNADFEYVAKVYAADFGFLEWRARSDKYEVSDGADSYVVHNSKIVAQTIHYTLEKAGLSKDI
jgi:hypothetical protein